MSEANKKIPDKSVLNRLKEYISKLFRYDINNESINKKRNIYYYDTGKDNIILKLKKIIKILKNEKKQNILDFEKYLDFIISISTNIDNVKKIDNKKKLINELIKNYEESIKNFKKIKNRERYKIYMPSILKYNNNDNIIEKKKIFYYDDNIANNLINNTSGGSIFRRFKVKRTLKKRNLSIPTNNTTTTTTTKKRYSNINSKTKKNIVKNIDTNLRLYELLKSQYKKKKYYEGNFISDYIDYIYDNNNNNNTNIITFVDIQNNDESNKLISKIINIMNLLYKNECKDINDSTNIEKIQNNQEENSKTEGNTKPEGISKPETNSTTQTQTPKSQLQPLQEEEGRISITVQNKKPIDQNPEQGKRTKNQKKTEGISKPEANSTTQSQTPILQQSQPEREGEGRQPDSTSGQSTINQPKFNNNVDDNINKLINDKKTFKDIMIDHYNNINLHKKNENKKNENTIYYINIIKNIFENIFNEITNKDYPGEKKNIPRNNHGSGNIFRQFLFTCVKLFYFVHNNNVNTNKLMETLNIVNGGNNKKKILYLLLSSAFKSIGRISEGSDYFIDDDNKEKKIKIRNNHFIISNTEYNELINNLPLSNYKDYSYMGALLCIKFLNYHIPPDNDDELMFLCICAYSLTYHMDNNIDNDQVQKLETDLSKFYLIHSITVSGHYMDHCRGGYSNFLGENHSKYYFKVMFENSKNNNKKKKKNMLKKNVIDVLKNTGYNQNNNDNCGKLQFINSNNSDNYQNTINLLTNFELLYKKIFKLTFTINNQNINLINILNFLNQTNRRTNTITKKSTTEQPLNPNQNPVQNTKSYQISNTTNKQKAKSNTYNKQQQQHKLKKNAKEFYPSKKIDEKKNTTNKII